MGSESSTRREKDNRESAATPRDVERALEQQRKMYEEKLQQMLTSQNSGTAAAAPVNSVRATVAHQQRAAPTELVNQQVHPNNAFDYNQKDVHSPTSLRSLYPHLPNAYSNFPQGMNNAAGPMHPSPPAANYGSAMYFDSSYQNRQQPQHPAQRNALVQPSAPPNETSRTNSRSRSQSRQRGGDNGNDVSCVTCGKMYEERIYQCNQGHSSCDLCRTRQVPCGQCRQQITTRRNFTLEQYVSEKRVKCPNHMDGCRLFIKTGDMAIHEKECPFKALQCPSLGSHCNWTGKLSQLADHFGEMHPFHNQGGVDKEMFLSNITSTSHLMHYFRIGNFNFLFHIKVSGPDARVYMAAQLIGTKHSAAKWDYEVHIYKKNEPRRKYQYTDRCSSANEPLQEIISSTKCAVIPQEYLNTFICGGSVAYKFYVKRDDFKTNDSETSNTTGDKENGPRTRRNYKKFVKKN